MPVRSLRKRYIAFNLLSDSPISYKELSQSIWMEILKLYGEFGAAKVGFRLIEYDQKTGFGILRCNHTAVGLIRSSLISLKNIGDVRVIPHVLRVSGTIKALKQKSRKQVNSDCKIHA